jgi:hypothetical protein
MSTLPAPRQSRIGCLTRLVLVFLLCGGVMAAVLAIAAPWGFYMGGRFHLFPYWQGWGRMHSNSAGGDYAIYVYFYPQIRRYSGPTHVAGTAMLCTPRGEKFHLTLGGDFERNIGRDLNGKKASFYMLNRTVKHIVSGGNALPELELRGQWRNPDLALDDHGSIARNFAPDATLYASHAKRPYMGEVSAVTLHEGGKSDFDAACAAVKK